MKKKTIAMIAVAATVSVAGMGAAEAASKKSIVKSANVATTRPSIGGMNVMGSNPIASVLAGLVTKGTITQAQSDAITAALTAARPAIGTMPRGVGEAGEAGKDGMGGFGGGPLAVNKQAIILSTLGIDAATLQAGKQAGKSLAAIAGSKTNDLIAALVTAESKAIDEAVTAGKMSAAQATTAKAGLTAHVTAEVNQVAPIGQAGRPGGMGHGHGRGFGGPAGAPGATPPNTNN